MVLSASTFTIIVMMVFPIERGTSSMYAPHDVRGRRRGPVGVRPWLRRLDGFERVTPSAPRRP